MDGEAVRQIANLADCSRVIESCAGLPDDQFYLRQTDGSYAIQTPGVSAAQIHVLSLSDMAEALDSLDCNPRVDPLVFYGEGSVSAYPGNDTRSVARLHLLFGEQFRNFRDKSWINLSGPNLVDQMETLLTGCFEATDMGRFKDIKFNRTEDGGEAKSSGKEAISRSIKRSLLTESGEPLPEEITLQFQMYEQLPEAVESVRCKVCIDYDNWSFSLIPLAGETVEALRRADEILRSRLRELFGEGVTLIKGSINR